MGGRSRWHEYEHGPGARIAIVLADRGCPLRDVRGRTRQLAAHDRDLGTRQIQVRLARGPLHPLHPLLPMRLDIDRWSSASTALELIPCRLIRPTADYFRAGRLLLDSLTSSLSQRPEPGVTLPIAS